MERLTSPTVTTTRALPLLPLLLSLLGGCYDALPVPSVPAPGGAEPSGPLPAERPLGPSAEGTGAAAAALRALPPLLERLGGRGELPPDARPGAGDWRAAELDKLHETVQSLCAAGSASCREVLTTLADSPVPDDEQLSVLALFLGPLRPQAELGFVVLGAPLLTGPDGGQRDRAFRMAVSAGVARRGEPDAELRRATLIPSTPPLGDPAVLLVEIASDCARVQGEHKGPDATGRIDLVLRSDCAGVTPPPPDPKGLPQASRAVWGLRLAPMTEVGATAYIAGAETPLLTYRPRPLDAKGPAGEELLKEP